MHTKINYIIWTIVVFLIIFFISLSIINQNKIKEYKIMLDNNKEVRIFTTNSKLSKEISSKLEEININDTEINIIKELETIFEVNNISKYLIHINDYVVTGEHYNNDNYQVATVTKDNTLFQIISLENQSLYSKNIGEMKDYDRIIVITDSISKIETLMNKIESLSLKNGKEVVEKEKNVTVYWLKENKEVQKVIMKS